MKDLNYLKGIIQNYEEGMLSDKQFDFALGAYIYSRPDVIPYVLTLLDIERKHNEETMVEASNVMSMAFAFINPAQRLTKDLRLTIFNKFIEVFDKYSQLPLNYLVKGYERKKDGK